MDKKLDQTVKIILDLQVECVLYVDGVAIDQGKRHFDSLPVIEELKNVRMRLVSPVVY